MPPKIKRKYNIRGLTQQQKEWLQNYESQTLLEPLGLDEMAADPSTFDEWAKYNIEHFETFAADALHSIDRDVPYNDEDRRVRSSTTAFLVKPDVAYSKAAIAEVLQL